MGKTCALTRMLRWGIFVTCRLQNVRFKPVRAAFLKVIGHMKNLISTLFIFREFRRHPDTYYASSRSLTLSYLPTKTYVLHM